MRVFLTGGTGYVGSAVLEALVRGGHQVEALVRNSEGAAKVQARGATPVLGDVLQTASWRDAATAADGSIHAAMESGPRAREVDAAAEGPPFPDLHVRHLGARAGAGPGRRERAAQSAGDRVVAPGARDARP